MSVVHLHMEVIDTIYYFTQDSKYYTTNDLNTNTIVSQGSGYQALHTFGFEHSEKRDEHT